ncbi:MAG: hypothetical protein ABIR47_16710, partial [Candidatus Kapaibacterium sp.]
EGGRLGAIADLGNSNDLAGKYNIAKRVGGGEVLSSIQVRNGKTFIVKTYDSLTYQEMTEGTAFLGVMPGTVAHARAAMGHLYLVRITDQYDSSFKKFVVLLVTSHVAGDNVTFRWRTVPGA